MNGPHSKTSPEPSGSAPAPEVVKAILDGRQRVDLQLDNLLDGLPLEWSRQSEMLGTDEPPKVRSDAGAAPEGHLGVAYCDALGGQRPSAAQQQ